MTTLMTPETSEGKPARLGIAARLLVPGFWAALSIVTMWLAVIFDGIYGGNMIFTGTDGSVTNIPSAVVLGLFAVIGTSAVAKRAFGRRDAELAGPWACREGSNVPSRPASARRR